MGCYGCHVLEVPEVSAASFLLMKVRAEPPGCRGSARGL
jgi:hypothetical protein